MSATVTCLPCVLPVNSGQNRRSSSDRGAWQGKPAPVAQPLQGPLLPQSHLPSGGLLLGLFCTRPTPLQTRPLTPAMPVLTGGHVSIAYFDLT